MTPNPLRTAALAAVLFLPLSPLLAAAYAPPAPDDPKAIVELIERTEAGNNAGDVEAWLTLFADDAVYMAPGAPAVTTREGLIEVAEAGFRHRASIDIEPVEVQVHGPWAFARTRVRGTVELQGSGETVSVDVKQLVIYRRNEDDRWQIARMISNSNAS